MANRIDFDGSRLTSTRTLVNGQKLGHLGMVDGSLTTLLSSGSASITSDELRFTGADAWDATGGHFPDVTARQEGQIFYAKLRANNITTASSIVALLDAASPVLANRVCQFNMRTDFMRASVLKPATLDFDRANELGVWEVVFVLPSGSGCFFYSKGPSDSSFVLQAVDGTITVNNFYFGLLHYYSTYTFDILDIKIPDALQPALVTPDASDDFSEANGTAISGKALDTGGSWVTTVTSSDLTTAHEVQSGKAQISFVSGVPTGSHVEIADVDTGESDVFLSGNCTAMGITAGYASGLTGRHDGTYADVVSLLLIPGFDCRLQERTSGSNATRGSTLATPAVNTEYFCTLSLIGNKPIATVAGIGSITDATLSSATTNTRHGYQLSLHRSSSVNYLSKVDNFRVDPATRTITI